MLRWYAIVVMALVLAACDKLWGSDGYTWKRQGDPAARYSWTWMPECMAARPSRACSDAINTSCPGFYSTEKWGCAWFAPLGTCRVYSIYSEAEAHAVKMNGRTHFDHEVGPLTVDGSPDPSKGYGHCAGFEHLESHARGN